MRSKEEQIKVILYPYKRNEWAKYQLKSGEKMEDKTYFDFINVTYEEVLDYALKHGFDEEAVVENFEGDINDQLVLEDRYWCLSEVDDQYEVFRVQRGNKTKQRFFPNREEAIKFIVKFFISYTFGALSYEYRRKHHPDITGSDFENIMSPFDNSLLKREKA
ncbi:MAG: hypothetical protein ACYTE8_09110 [Planctomycetota bacterium]|jgi:hypothetical protein